MAGRPACLAPPAVLPEPRKDTESCRPGEVVVPPSTSGASEGPSSGNNTSAQHEVLSSKTEEKPTTKPATKPLTNAQKLAKALKACKKLKKKSKRHACEVSARKKYGAKSKKAVQQGRPPRDGAQAMTMRALKTKLSIALLVAGRAPRSASGRRRLERLGRARLVAHQPELRADQTAARQRSRDRRHRRQWRLRADRATTNKITLHGQAPGRRRSVPAPGEASTAGEAGQQLGKNRTTRRSCCRAPTSRTRSRVRVTSEKRACRTESTAPAERVRQSDSPAGCTMTNEVTVTGGGIEPAELDPRRGQAAGPDPVRASKATNCGPKTPTARSTPRRARTHSSSRPTFNLSKTLFTRKCSGGGAKRQTLRLAGAHQGPPLRPAAGPDRQRREPPAVHRRELQHVPHRRREPLRRGHSDRGRLGDRPGARGPGRPDTQAVPIFNLVPDPGEPARFGFEIHNVPVVLTTKVRSGKDYGVEVSVHYATEAANVLNSQVIFWGVPGDPRHDSERGWACLVRRLLRRRSRSRAAVRTGQRTETAPRS